MGCKYMDISLKPLQEALASLKKALDQPKDEFIRDSVIQRFEYTFEFCWKTLKRYFEWNQKLSESNVKNILREAGKQGIISSVEEWFEFLEARNQTSHTYNENKAEATYLLCQRFYPQAVELFNKLEKLIK
jgi:nucleotidyltransferase substrate binding protein (TIGR01987 family)